MSNSRPLLLRHRLQDPVGSVEVSPHDGGLVLQHGHQQLEADHAQLLVAEVEPVVGWDVPQEVHGPVQVGDGDDLSSDVVVESVDAVGVDEAISDPESGLDSLAHLSQNIKSVLYPILTNFLWIVCSGSDIVRDVLEDEVRLLGYNAAELPSLAPVDRLGLDLDPPDQLVGLPVVESQPGHRLDSQQGSAVNCLCSKVRFEGLLFLEVLEELDGGAALADGVLRAVPGPDELQRGAEAFVPERHGGVDDVLPVTADHDEPPVRIVLDCLGVHLTAAHVLHGERESLSVLDLVLLQRLQTRLLHLAVFGPNYLSAGVHGHGGLLPAELDQDGALVIPESHVVAAPEDPNTPDPLQAVVECVLQPVGVGMPDLHCPVLRPRQDDGQLRVEADAGDVLGMALQCLDAGLVLIVPDLHHPVVCPRDEVGLVTSHVIVDTVNSLLVSLQCEVRLGRSQLPHLHRPVQGGGGEGVVVLGVDPHLHNVMGVSLKHLLAEPALLPVPELDQHVIWEQISRSSLIL